MIGLFDVHTHLDFPVFDSDRQQVARRSVAAGVSDWFIAGADPHHWDRVVQVAAELGCPYALGVHPWWVDGQLDDWLVRLGSCPTPPAYGETGLDHHHTSDPAGRARQRRSARAHLALARERGVPVVLHCVRATSELLDLVAADGLPDAGGMIHAWNGPSDQVSRAVSLGLHLSFGPDLARSPRARASLAATPLDRILLETDAPDRPILPGARGEPADLVAIAHIAAETLGLSVPAVAAATASNARRLLAPAAASN